MPPTQDFRILPKIRKSFAAQRQPGSDLARRVNRLPSPACAPLDHVPQTGEGREVLADYPGPLVCRPVKDGVLAGGGHLRPPELPLLFPDVVARIGVNRVARIIEGATDSVSRAMTSEGATLGACERPTRRILAVMLRELVADSAVL